MPRDYFRRPLAVGGAVALAGLLAAAAHGQSDSWYPSRWGAADERGAANAITSAKNLATEKLARDRAYEFVFFFAPLKLKGGTGSPANPIAIR